MSSAFSPVRSPGSHEVAEICALRDTVVRNLRITEFYHRLSVAMAARTGAGANWCTFATWASRQAGRTIRGEDVLDKLAAEARSGWTLVHPVRSVWRTLLRRGLFQPETALGRLVRNIHSPFDAVERASAAVARGNLKVFEEIGLAFARYLEQCPPDLPPGSSAFEAFLNTLKPGDPPDGQTWLRRAFMRYQKVTATQETAPAQQLFLANLKIGLHEQTRLQPEIQEAMESIPDTVQDLGERARRILFPGTGRLAEPMRGAVAMLLRYPVRSVRRYLRAVTRRAITESLMVLTFPGPLVIALGRDLDQPHPPALKDITDIELRNLLERLGSPDGARGAGARDWAVLDQRMLVIAQLFRAFHETRELFTSPFTPAQIEQCLAGVVPGGDL